MQRKNKKKNTFVAENACGSHFFCNLHPISGKACILIKGIRGSNPRLSAGN